MNRPSSKASFVIVLTALITTLGHLCAQTPTFENVTYANVDGMELKLDLYRPDNSRLPYLIVWIHGGAWRSGSKSNPPKVFIEHGFALASLDFRQSTEARFPAQIHDIKGAIRFLRANAAKFGIRKEWIAIAGSSSGGHLAVLTGVTNGKEELEGAVGGNSDQSSDVQAIIDYFGASDLTTILSQSTPHGLNVRKPALDLLLGGQPDSVKAVARLASPVFQLDKKDPPLLILHGDQDPQMPVNQSLELEGAYKKTGLIVDLDIVYGAAHGGDVFFSGEHLKRALAFLERAIKKSNP